jgi:hypothetical protein
MLGDSAVREESPKTEVGDGSQQADFAWGFGCLFGMHLGGCRRREQVLRPSCRSCGAFVVINPIRQSSSSGKVAILSIVG